MLTSLQSNFVPREQAGVGGAQGEESNSCSFLQTYSVEGSAVTHRGGSITFHMAGGNRTISLEKLRRPRGEGCGF